MNQNTRAKNHKKSIFFVGRLEREKGVDILADIVRESIRRELPHEYHIFGDGSHFSYFSNFENNRVILHGNVPHEELQQHLPHADILLMPSRFLETFGLSALEALSAGVPVVGFRKGGLTDFIPPELAMDEQNPVESFFDIIKKPVEGKPDIRRFSYAHWQKHLTRILGNSSRVLLVHDYLSNVGGAEVYIEHLDRELQKLAKNVSRYGYAGHLTSWKRRALLALTPVSFWRYFSLRKIIRETRPDMIFSHSVLRYVGYWGMLAIRHSGVPHVMMHHDLGLVSPRPSRITSEQEIPEGLRFGQWIRGQKSIISLLGTSLKYLVVRCIWGAIPLGTRHLVPSAWMQSHFQKYTSDAVGVFAHTIFKG